jgi:hypothetical protein
LGESVDEALLHPVSRMNKAKRVMIKFFIFM